MPQSTLRRPTAPEGVYGACGAGFFFFFSRPHYEKKAGGGGICTAWAAPVSRRETGAAELEMSLLAPRGALLRALVCPGPVDDPGRMCKHGRADPKVATALPQPTEAGGVSADTCMPSGGCRLLSRQAGLAIGEPS